MLRFANSTERQATVSTRHLSFCPNVNNEVAIFCDETLESDFTEKGSNVALDSGKNINKPSSEKNSKKNNIISLKQDVRRLLYGHIRYKKRSNPFNKEYPCKIWRKYSF